MVHTVSHTEVLQCSPDDMGEAGKYADVILPTLVPDYFTKSVFLEGHGEPGCIRIVKMGPEIKERIDKIDDANKTLSTTISEGDPRYSSFSAEIPVCDTRCEVVWTATYELGHGEAGSIHAVKIGPMFLDVEEVSERMDFVDDANKTLGYTVLEGSPGYHYFNVGLKFSPKATAGTTDATWTASYVPMADMGPPEHVKDVYIKVLKAFVSATKAN
ncbi:unnamed protein product [Sphagnum troendelagicum]